MQLVAPGIYAIPGLKMGRAYLVEQPDALLLIDTSSDGASQRILDGIDAIGRRPDELRAIVATHYHHDHIGNVAALIEYTGAALYAHEADAPYIEAREPWMRQKGPFGKVLDRAAPKQVALRVDHVLRDGDELPFAGGLRVVHAPGHTPGNIALHAAAARTIFVGDAFMNLLGLHQPISTSSHDMAQARETIGRLAALEFEVALPGHGAPLVGRASEKLAAWSRVWLREGAAT